MGRPPRLARLRSPEPHWSRCRIANGLLGSKPTKSLVTAGASTAPRLLRICFRSTAALGVEASSHQRPEELRRRSDRIHGHVAVAAELDVDSPFVAHFAQCADKSREIHRSLSEHQVLVDAGDHVLDMDVHDARLATVARESECPLPACNGRVPGRW